MSAPTTSAPLTELDKHDPVAAGDLLAVWNEHSARWRTFRVWKVVEHRTSNQYGSNRTHARRTIHLVRDIDAVPERGTGTAYTHWSKGAGYGQINHAQGYWRAEGEAGEAWVRAQRAIEAQDDIDAAARAEAQRVSPKGIAERLRHQARELDRQAASMRSKADDLERAAVDLRAEADLISPNNFEL